MDKTSFRRILKYQRPKTKESDIPHHTKLREEIMAKALDAEQLAREHFKVCSSSNMGYVAQSCYRRFWGSFL